MRYTSLILIALAAALDGAVPARADPLPFQGRTVDSRPNGSELVFGPHKVGTHRAGKTTLTPDALTASSVPGCASDAGSYPAFLNFWLPDCNGTFIGENIRTALTRGTSPVPMSNPRVVDPSNWAYTSTLINKVYDASLPSSSLLINTDLSKGGGSNAGNDNYSVDFQISSTVRPGMGTEPGKHWMVNWDGWVAPGSGQHFWTMLEADSNYANADCGPDAKPVEGKSCFNPTFWFNYNNFVTTLGWLYTTTEAGASYWGRAKLVGGKLTAIDWEQAPMLVDGVFSKMMGDVYLYPAGSYNPKAMTNPHALAGQQGNYYRVSHYIDGKNVRLKDPPADNTYAFQWAPSQVQYGITLAQRDTTFKDGRILHGSIVQKEDFWVASNSKRVFYVAGHHEVGWDSTDAKIDIGAAYGQGQRVCFNKSCSASLVGTLDGKLTILNGQLAANNGISLPFAIPEEMAGSFICGKSGGVLYMKKTPCNQ